MPLSADNTAAGRTVRWSRIDTVLLWLVAAAGAVGSVVLLVIPRFYIPAEDSVILFQFSRNLAQTGAITYIPHGPHAEGATDFAWMVLIALGMKLHIDPYWFVSMINFVCVILLGVLLLKLAARRVTVLPLLFLMGAFALQQQYSASLQGFSTLPFACLLVALVAAFVQQQDVAAPLIALVLCLFRPDGVVFAVPMLLAGLVVYPRKGRRLALDAALFVLPGLAYFIWRWHYFGHLLPLPFLVKSDTQRWMHVLVPESLQECAESIVFAVVVLAIALRGRWSDARNRAVVLGVMVVPTLFYMAERLDQNIGNRFFIYLPVGTAVLVAMNWRHMTPQRARLALRMGFAAWFLLVFPLAFRDAHGSWGGQFTTRKAIAMDLAKLPHGTLLTTEAGVVPYYSHWTSFDSWGLSTAEFAEHPIQPGDVEALHPDVVLIHTGGPASLCVAQPEWKTPYAERTWSNMNRNLVAGADPAHYDLWLLPLGNLVIRAQDGVKDWQGEHECWFVRRDNAERADVERVLAAHGGLPAAAYFADQQAASIAPSSPGKLDRLKALWHSWR